MESQGRAPGPAAERQVCYATRAPAISWPFAGCIKGYGSSFECWWLALAVACVGVGLGGFLSACGVSVGTERVVFRPLPGSLRPGLGRLWFAGRPVLAGLPA